MHDRISDVADYGEDGDDDHEDDEGDEAAAGHSVCFFLSFCSRFWVVEWLTWGLKGVVISKYVELVNLRRVFDSVTERERQDKMVRAAFLNQIRRRAEREKKSGSRGGLKNQKKK